MAGSERSKAAATGAPRADAAAPRAPAPADDRPSSTPQGRGLTAWRDAMRKAQRARERQRESGAPVPDPGSAGRTASTTTPRGNGVGADANGSALAPVRIDALADLRQALVRQRRQRDGAQRAARAARLEEQQSHARQEALRAQFVHAVGAVHALPERNRLLHPPVPVEPIARMREADEREALAQSLSDQVDVDTLLLTDDGLSYRREGVGADVVSRLRRGQWSIRAQLDLHGMRREEAREALVQFIRQCGLQGVRCVRIVHGKGHGSPGRQPVLKSKVQRWLAQCEPVQAFTQASGPDGGAGALIVLLTGLPPGRG